MKKILLTSHPKSGRKLFRSVWSANINGWSMIQPDRNHIGAEEDVKPGNVVLLVRDGRDVLTTAYWSNQTIGREKELRNQSFTEFLNSKYREVLNRKKEVLFKLNPVEYWVYYYSKWLEESTPKINVRYEDLHECQELMIRAIRMFYDFDHLKEVEVLDRSRSYSFEYKETDTYTPRTPGNWKKVFDHEDNEYVWKIAGKLMEKFGYERV